MSGGSSETENSTHDQGGDTDSVEEEDEEENMSQSPPPSQVPPLPAVSLTETWEWNLKVNQLIVKGVFSRVLNREEMIDVLKKKFSVKQKNLTGLKPSELMSVLAKKLTRNEYCRLNVKHGEVKNKDDITIVREITF